MTPYEIIYRLLFAFTLPHYQLINALISKEIKHIANENLTILDIGGRKSPYTIGLKHKITIIDMPQQSEVQKKLNLGLSNESLRKIREKRSNIHKIILGDFLTYDFLQESFDIIIAVEVIEHIREDEKFIAKVYSILKREGLCLFTTPNGDHIELNRQLNPDHVRHYRKTSFENLLNRYFSDVKVIYFAQFTHYFLKGLKPWKIKKPIQTISSMYGNFVTYHRALKYNGEDCAYLVGIARKK